LFTALSVSSLVVLFLLAAGIVWVAGIQLARATDILAERWGLGEALGGAILLAIATNLPEVAIVASGALRGDLDVAVGNVLGGIAAQTVVLVWLDALGRGPPLRARAASPALIIEGVMVMAVLAVCLIGAQLPAALSWGGVFPPDAAILLLWIAGLFVVSRTRRPRSPAAPKKKAAARAQPKAISTARAVTILIVAAVATLAGGVALEASGQLLAERWGISGLVFGATVLAVATSLPEISTGWAAIRLGDDALAVSDILGGNAFLPVLFLEASLLSGHAVLPHAHGANLYLAGLGILLTAVYVVALVWRPQRRVFRMGVDSLAVLVLYALGMAGLLTF
jgi:cation:H+ antiporter